MKSDYQLFKLWWLAVLPLTKDAIHLYIGFLCLMVALVAFRRRLSSYQALIPGWCSPWCWKSSICGRLQRRRQRSRHHQYELVAAGAGDLGSAAGVHAVKEENTDEHGPATD